MVSPQAAPRVAQGWWTAEAARTFSSENILIQAPTLAWICETHQPRLSIPSSEAISSSACGSTQARAAELLGTLRGRPIPRVLYEDGPDTANCDLHVQRSPPPPAALQPSQLSPKIPALSPFPAALLVLKSWPGTRTRCGRGGSTHHGEPSARSTGEVGAPAGQEGAQQGATWCGVGWLIS